MSVVKAWGWDRDGDGCIDDTDGDGVADPYDRCAAGDDNIDVDRDGLPTPATLLLISDGDGIADHHDSCPGHNDSIDVDLDGVPDGCDDD